MDLGCGTKSPLPAGTRSSIVRVFFTSSSNSDKSRSLIGISPRRIVEPDDGDYTVIRCTCAQAGSRVRPAEIAEILRENNPAVSACSGLMFFQYPLRRG